MQVTFVGNGRGGKQTGLSRYGATLRSYLRQQEVGVEVSSSVVPLPTFATRWGRALGWDLDTFFRNYPVRARPVEGDLYHLVSENLASLLSFQRLEPVVVTVHAFFTYFLRSDPELSMYNHIFHRGFDALAARGLQRADAIIAVSNYVARLLIDDLGIPEDRVHVVYEAVDHEEFYPHTVTRAFKAKYQLDDDYIHLLYVGSEQPRKNFPLLLRAFSRLRREFPHVRLLKVGQPEISAERERALNVIRQEGLEDSVVFLGHVGKELPDLYAASDVFVFPSLYEGFGFPPLEAMACGTATVCSNTTSLPEVVGDAAWFIDPSDEDGLVEALKRLVRDDGLRHIYAEKGIARSREFSWHDTARQTLAVYEHVLNDGGR